MQEPGGASDLPCRLRGGKQEDKEAEGCFNSGKRRTPCPLTLYAQYDPRNK